MALKFNGTDIKNIIYNGVSLGKLIFNGVTVWLKEMIIFANGNTSLSNGCTLVKFSSSGNSYHEFLDGTFNVVANGSAGAQCVSRITTFDITDFDNLEIIAKTNENSDKVRTDIDLLDINGNTLKSLIISNANITTSFKTFTIDISGYTGQVIIHIKSTIWSGGKWGIIYFKNMRVY